jgi:hypothetical protein
MAELSTGSGNSNNTLYFIVGGLVVAVALVAYGYYGGYLGHRSATTTTEQSITTPTPSGTSTTTTTTTTPKP